MEYKHHKGRSVRHLVSIPFIWMMIIPMVIFDIFMEVYHRICFPLYGIKIVKRSEYIRMDRQKLSYLKFYQKVNCAYCGYANGLMHYGTRIAGDTEKYWCGIQHKQTPGFHPQEHHKTFLKYGDVKAYKKYCKLKK
jgi:hypothetical protein